MGCTIKPAVFLTFLVIPLLLSHDTDAAQVVDPAWRGISQPVAVVRQIQAVGSQFKQLQAAGNRRGTRVIFSGPPSPDKANTGQLLANHLGQPLYRVDLGTVVSKYVGETEKNLDRLFTRAESGNWILFFDEADDLFGKRTDVHDSHDKYANQAASYLLQRMETFSGLIIISSNNPATKTTIRHEHAVEFNAVAKPPRPPITPR